MSPGGRGWKVSVRRAVLDRRSGDGLDQCYSTGGVSGPTLVSLTLGRFTLAHLPRLALVPFVGINMGVLHSSNRTILVRLSMRG